MTSPAATVGLTYAATDLQQSDLQWFFQVVKGLNEPPSVRGVDVTVPALTGRIEGNRKNDVLAIELVGWVRGDPAETTRSNAIASYRDNAQAIRTLFATNRARAELIATLENGSVLSISARPLNAIWTDAVQSEFVNVSIELEGYDDWTEVSGS